MFIDRVMNAWIKSAGMLGVLAAVAGIVVLPAQPVNAGHHRGGGQGGGGCQGLQTAAGLSTPSCGLKTDPCPSCPPSSDENRVTQGYAINQMKLNLTGLDVKRSASAPIGSTPQARAPAATPGRPLLVETRGIFLLHRAAIRRHRLHWHQPGPVQPVSDERPHGFYVGRQQLRSWYRMRRSRHRRMRGATLLVRNVTPDFSTGKPVPAGLKPDDFIRRSGPAMTSRIFTRQHKQHRILTPPLLPLRMAASCRSCPGLGWAAPPTMTLNDL